MIAYFTLPYLFLLGSWQWSVFCYTRSSASVSLLNLKFPSENGHWRKLDELQSDITTSSIGWGLNFKKKRKKKGKNKINKNKKKHLLVLNSTTVICLDYQNPFTTPK